MALRGETRLSAATVDTSLVTGLLESITLSFVAVNFVVLFIVIICNQLRLLRTNAKKCQLSGAYIEANMKMSGRMAEKVLTLPKHQGHLHLSKGTSFTLT